MPFGSITTEVNKQVQQVANAALNLLFPPRCAGCDRPGSDFCATCAASLSPTGSVVCAVCGEPLPSPGLCSRCSAGSYAFRRVRSAFRFEGALRHAIHALKYEGRRSIAAPLGYLMAGELARPDNGGVFLCPVPLHPQRFSERGFNQSAELAYHVAKAWGVGSVAADVLQRVRATERQVGLDHAARQANVAGAFQVGDPDQVRGCEYILVDDVCTTGATLDACARALLSAGAVVVDGITLARQV